MATKIYSRYDRPKRDGVTFNMPTLTQQHFARECDINEIIKRAITTGDTAIFTPQQRAAYYDCTIYEDYQQALERIADIEDDFASLPSHVRKEFGNDPDAYVAFMTDPANFEKAVKLGLLEGVKTSSEKTQEAPPPSVSEPPAAGAPEGSKTDSDA
ncbi:TPA_asm: hypothetical protein GBY79_00130 [Salmonella enterica subsp. salamae]|nr:hypothetical protein [Salmonella enterica subsp. salamae]HAB3813392.1 hypothetical protein [Salmonella enterica subsp. salamae]